MRRPAFTVIEMVMVLAIVAAIAALALPTFSRLLDRVAVQGAATDIATALAIARHRAVMRASRTACTVDPALGRLTVHTGADTALVRDVIAAHGVRLATARPTVVYGPTGLAIGLSNTTIVITRGAAAETVVVSRLGRVRY